jgi:hypothetical protein
VNDLPYLLPWVRVLLLIRSITFKMLHRVFDNWRGIGVLATPWGHESWPQVKPLLRRALEMRRQIARDGWWN